MRIRPYLNKDFDVISGWITDERSHALCFIAIKDPDEKNNVWTVWSADIASEWLEKDLVDKEVKESAWRHANHCGHCGSCSGGRHKMIFGKEFDDICGCTFRIDNPKLEDLVFLKEMVEIKIREIHNEL